MKTLKENYFKFKRKGKFELERSKLKLIFERNVFFFFFLNYKESKGTYLASNFFLMKFLIFL